MAFIKYQKSPVHFVRLTLKMTLKLFIVPHVILPIIMTAGLKIKDVLYMAAVKN